MGIKYEYEPDGYVLGNTCYLPDFWLPESKSFLEIKRKRESPIRQVRVYLAGKADGSEGWRSKLDPGRFGHVVTGPDIFDTRHGSTLLHSQMLAAQKLCNDTVINQGNPKDFFPDNRTPREIVESCLHQICESDALFAWINSIDCYGTLVEIGYAIGKGIPVFVAYGEELDTFYRNSSDFPEPEFDSNGCEIDIGKNTELWFSIIAADWFYSCDSPQGGYRNFANNCPEIIPGLVDDEGHKCRMLALATQRPVFMIRGVPHDNPESGEFEVDAFGHDFGTLLNWGIRTTPLWDDYKSPSAMDYARSARFEHGEKP
jgi:hypothetical protein